MAVPSVFWFNKRKNGYELIMTIMGKKQNPLYHQTDKGGIKDTRPVDLT